MAARPKKKKRKRTRGAPKSRGMDLDTADPLGGSMPTKVSRHCSHIVDFHLRVIIESSPQSAQLRLSVLRRGSTGLTVRDTYWGCIAATNCATASDVEVRLKKNPCTRSTAWNCCCCGGKAVDIPVVVISRQYKQAPLVGSANGSGDDHAGFWYPGQ